MNVLNETRDNAKNGVVILNYNSHDLTVALVEQIVNYESIHKICVVDNNSGDDFDSDFNSPKIHYIKNPQNIGYNSGNNVGLKYLVDECGCEYVYIANPDVDFEDTAIKEMSEAMINDPNLVLISTKRYGHKGETIHQFFDFPEIKDSIRRCFFLTRRNIARDTHFIQNEKIDNSSGLYYVDAVPGAFFGMKSTFLKEINFLYEGIFLYGEEIFLGKQANKLGYKAGIINTSCYYHNHIQIRFSESSKKMFLRDRISLIKYYKYFNLLKWYQNVLLTISVYLGTLEYNMMFHLYRFLKNNNINNSVQHTFCSHEASNYKKRKLFDYTTSGMYAPRYAEEYISYIANGNYERFFELGHAIEGHNGPHGHMDTPVRNTAHYLIIYSYLFSKTNDEKYKEISEKFANYLCEMQKKTISGAIECMKNDSFDRLNGLIGQAWVIEALVYYYEKFQDNSRLEVAKEIFYSQEYDYSMHVWHRIELDGRNIGIDNAYNHQVMFAAASCKLADYCNDPEIDRIIRDFLNNTERDFNIYNNGLLKHSINIKSPEIKKAKIKKIIKFCLTPLKFFDSKFFDAKYIERAYHIFDIYCFSILSERYSDLPLFNSDKYKKAVKYALDIEHYNKDNGVDQYLKTGRLFNVYSYSYNSPVFEYPYIAINNGFDDEALFNSIYDTQEKLMLDKQTGMFSRNNPDLETWNARAYEIIRYLEKRLT